MLDKESRLVSVRGRIGHGETHKDVYIGRGTKSEEKSKWANPFKVDRYGRDKAIMTYGKYIKESPTMMQQVGELAGKKLLCHGKGQVFEKVVVLLFRKAGVCVGNDLIFFYIKRNRCRYMLQTNGFTQH